ncbi:MAG: hypothetical protein ACJA1B_002614 [Polaribacter sp.]|jgi:hypothetical protein
MIHLFRKIRLQLIRDNGLHKYLLYAVGEVVLVVVGIALALQFNNWNIENENSKKEEWYLINVAEDVEYQRAELVDLIANYKYSIAVSKSLLKDFNRFNSFAKIDSLNEKLNALTFADNFPNINNTYQELVSSGQQTLIKEKELSLELIDFYLFCEDNFLDVKNNNDNIYYKEVYPVLNKLSQIYVTFKDLNEDEESAINNINVLNSYLTSELEKPANILALLNAIKTQTMILVAHLELAEETLIGGKELVVQIDEYLGLTADMVNHYD